MLQQFGRYRLLTFNVLFLAILQACKGDDQGMEAEQLKCFKSVKADDLWKACWATYDPGYNDLPVWGALIKITADCMPYTAGVANQTAYGTFWAIGVQAFFDKYLENFNNLTGLKVGFHLRTIQEYVLNPMPMWPTADAPGAVDYWMVGAEVFGEGITRKAFTDLTFLLDREDHYRFTDIPLAWRSAASSAFSGSYTALPFMVMPWPLMYRRDVFDQYGIAIPQTWDDVLAVAEQYGKGPLDAGQPDLGFCFESNVACGLTHAVIGYILASMVQLNGSNHGTWFDPENLRPLFTTDAMREALQIYMKLKAHSIDDSTPCQEVYGMLASGRCLMLWSFSFAFKHGSATSGPLRGRQGVAQVPGSARVLHRPTGRMVPCNPELCPYATRIYSGETSTPNTTMDPARGVLVNRVLPLECISFTINAFAPLPRQAAAFALFHTFTSPGVRLTMLLSPASELVPLRFSELEESPWIDAGYEPVDVRSFLQASRDFLTHPNVYLNLRIPGVFEIYALMQTLAQRAVWGNYTYDEIISYADVATKGIIRRSGGQDYLLDLYRKSIDYMPPAPPASPPGGLSQRHQQYVRLVSVLVPIMGVLLLGAVALWGYMRYSRLTANARAALSAAPGAGPNTTLLVTDIQDSTVLWESLPAEVMDFAVKLHHRVIREALLLHRGYESATEGDSFILAFEKPDNALSFALAAQAALLRADWPQQLQSNECAASLIVSCDAATCATLLSYLAPSRLRSTLASSLEAAIAASGGINGSVGSGSRFPLSHRRSLELTSASISPGPEASRRWPRATATATRGFISAPRVSINGRHTLSGSIGTGIGANPVVGGEGGGRALGDGHAESISATTVAGNRRAVSGKTLQPLSALPRPMSSGITIALMGPPISAGSGIIDGSIAASVDFALHTESGMAPAPTSAPTLPTEMMPSLRMMTAELSLGEEEAPSVAAAAAAAGVLLGGGSASDGCGYGGGAGVGMNSDELCPSRASSLLGNVMGRSGVPIVATTLRTLLEQSFPVRQGPGCDGAIQPQPSGGGALLFRGLRVRMGMHCGISAQEVQYNHASSRIVYPGRTQLLAKAVSDVGRGGQILMSGAVRASLQGKAGGGHGVGVASSAGISSGTDALYIVLSVGWHVLKEGASALDLYSVIPQDLLPRAGYMAGLRSLEEQSPGVLSAPLGRVTVAVAHVQDSEDFAGWGLEASLDTHRAMCKEAARLVREQAGYLLRTPPGSFQAIFTSPLAAVHWLLGMQEELGPAPLSSTSPSLQPLSIFHSMNSGSGSCSDVTFVLLKRAVAVAQLSTFHLKGGVEVGPLTATLGLDGEMSYSGAAVKRAACLAANAALHEVLISMDAAREVLGEDHPATLLAAPVAQLRGGMLATRSKKPRTSIFRPSPVTSLQPCPDQTLPLVIGNKLNKHQPIWSGELRRELGEPAELEGVAPTATAAGSSGGGGGERHIGLENPTLASVGLSMLAAARVSGDAATPTIKHGTLVFGSGMRLVKFKGSIIEACTVALAGNGGGDAVTGIAAAATPTNTSGIVTTSPRQHP